MRGEPEPVAQRPGQRTRPGGGPHEVNGATSNGIDVAPGPFPTTTSTRKSSIARYSISLGGGARDAVDLVDEQHVALDEVGQHRGQIARASRAGPEVTRSEEPNSAAMIIASDVLPDPAVRQQDVIRCAATVLGALDDQLQLLANAG